jgi:ribonucleoside-triphosphate reductase (thioredoxin)
LLVQERFHLPQDFKRGLSLRQPLWGFDVFSEAVYFRTYSRTMEDGRQESWADTVCRVVEGVMSIRKDWLINFVGKRWDEAYYQQIARELALFIFDMKVLPPGRGLWAMGTDYVYTRGSHALNNCFSGDTEIITTHGVRRLRDISDNGCSYLVWTGDDHGWSPASVRSFGVQSTNRITFRPQGLRSNQRNVVDATADHRWILADGEETTDLKVGDVVPSSAVSKGALIAGDVIEGDDYEEWEAGFRHGLVFADGTKANTLLDGTTRFKVRLCGDKQEHLVKFSGHATITHPESAQGDPIATLLATKLDLKALPQEDRKFRSVVYVRGFIDGWIAGDGCKESGEALTLDTQDQDAAVWLHRYAAMAGYSVSGVTIENRDTNYGPRSAPLIRTRLTKDAGLNWVVESIEPKGEEEVYCAVVPGIGQFTLANGMLTGNCGFVNVTDSLSEPAAWLMDSLMCGVGVGFGTYEANLPAFKLPNHDHYETYTVPDSREGWVESVRRLIETYETGSHVIEMDYSAIRPEGSRIHGFGGTSSGPAPLIKLHERLVTYLDAAALGEVSSTRTIADVMNAVGGCVVAGNVRRSAEIAVGGAYDDEFRNLKNYELYPEREEIGWMSNNSIALQERDDFQVLPHIADNIITNGEPGLLNMINIRKFGRIGDRMEDRAVGINPCGEIPLESYELCNLVEVFPTRCNGSMEVWKAMELATFYASTVSLLRSHNPLTNDVVARNRRIGVSVSGVADWIDSSSVSHVFDVLNRGYENVVRPTNRRLAQEAGVPASVRLTTVKPSGTISILAGVSSGVHYPTDGYVLRRMRVGANTPTAEILKKSGVPVEDDAYTPNTLVFEFPVRYGKGRTRSVKSVSVYEQAAVVAMLQRCWADNAVSNTLVVQPHEFKQVERVLALFAPQVKSMSMLPDLEEGAYAQMPQERINKADYEERRANVRAVDWSALTGSDGTDSRFCTNDSCEV